WPDRCRANEGLCDGSHRGDPPHGRGFPSREWSPAMFSIFRSESATSLLKQTWEQADEALQRAILRATELLNRALAQCPHEQGESRGDGRRILFEAPLGIEFEIDEARRMVHIQRTWAYRT